MTSKSKTYVLGIDYGTDSCRALIVDTADGCELAAAVSLYSRWSQGLYCDPQQNRYRQHPLDYIESMEQAVREVLSQVPAVVAGRIVGLCFDTTGSTPALIDATGMPLALRPEFAEDPDAMFMLWKDHTAVAEAEQITGLAKQWHTDYTAYEGGIYSSEWAWAKVLHAVRTNPAIAIAAVSWIEHCDWMPALLTGRTHAADILRSRCAAGHKGMWHESWGWPSTEFLGVLHPALAPMREHLAPTTHTSDQNAGTLTREWAIRLGLSEGIPICVGLLDAHSGAVGACVKPYVLTRILGTSTCDILIIDPKTIAGRCIKGICGQVDGSVIPGYIGLEAGQSAFGDVYAWFREIVAWPLHHLMPAVAEELSDQIIPALSEAAAQISPTDSAPVALDWMNGRRTPYADQNLKGAIEGLTLGTSAPALFRTLVEATAFGSKAIVEHLHASGIEIHSIHALGGIAQKSPFVMQVLSDVLGMPIRVVRSGQACALGATMFAAVAARLYPSVEQAQQHMGSDFSAEYTPNPSAAAVYGQLYEKYKLLAAQTANRT